MLQVTDLHVYYGNICAVRGVSFSVDEGEVVTIIGSNGAGKSTTLLSITGLLRPAKGELQYLDRNISTASPYEIVKLGISLCPEGRRIFSSLTVYENLLMGASQKRDHQAIKRSIEKVHGLFPVLKERVRQRGGTLSGGEQQMLAVGRALMNEPRLLLLDEPSLGLAPMLVNRTFGVIEQLRETGTTILLVEQNARKALEISDRAYVLEVGEIALEGKSEDIKDREGVRAAYLGG